MRGWNGQDRSLRGEFFDGVDTLIVLFMGLWWWYNGIMGYWGLAGVPDTGVGPYGDVQITCGLGDGALTIYPIN